MECKSRIKHEDLAALLRNRRLFEARYVYDRGSHDQLHRDLQAIHDGLIAFSSTGEEKPAAPSAPAVKAGDVGNCGDCAKAGLDCACGRAACRCCARGDSGCNAYDL